MNSINFSKFLDRQMTEGMRAFLIHFPALRGKTHFARRVTELRSDVCLLDLLDWFLNHPDLPPIRQIDSTALWSILRSLNVPQHVILVDHPDFLFNTWKPSEKENFILKTRSIRSPGDTSKTFVFIFQTDDVLSAARFVNSYNDERVLPLDAFNAL